MITRIELKNFMSHRHTVIEPAPGLTVLVGPNNVGKSAVVAALQILCRNDTSTYVMQHGQKQCSVTLHTQDGDEQHVIQWRRKKSPSYVIDGQTFDRLNSSVPEELHRALRLPRVDDIDDAEFDIHFGAQKSPIFLLGAPPQAKARFFAASSDVHRLVAMQQRHKEKRADAVKEKNQLERDSKRVNQSLALLEPIVDIDHRLKAVEHVYDDLKQQADRIQKAQQHVRLMRREADLADHARTIGDTLETLAPPPKLFDTASLDRMIQQREREQHVINRLQAQLDVLNRTPPVPAFDDLQPLERLIGQLRGQQQTRARASAEQQALASLSPIPEQRDVRELDQLIRSLSRAARNVQRCEQQHRRLRRLPAPPASAEVAPLQKLCEQLGAAIEQQAARQAELELLQEALLAAKDELRQAADGRDCPWCGSPLDPERLLRRAPAGGCPHE